MSISDRIRALREKKGWTQNHLADVSGVPQPTIWRLEKGRILNPKTNVLRQLAKGLDVTADYLLMDEDDKDLPSFDDVLRHDPVGQAIFRNYEVLSARGKETASSLVSWLVEREKKDQEQK